MFRLFLARHGETDHNKEGILQGQIDREVNEKGRKQAEKLAERLEKIDLDGIYSSSLKRSQATAEIVSERHDLEVEPVDSLKQINLGELQGGPASKWHEKIREKGEEISDWSPEGGESIKEVENRAIGAVEEFSRRHPDGDVLAVAHGGANRAIMMGLLDIPRDRYLNIEQGNVCLNVLKKDDRDGWILERVNDRTHIE